MILNIDYLWAHSSCPQAFIILEYSDMKLETHWNCEKGRPGHIQASKGKLLLHFLFSFFRLKLICFMLFNKYDYDYAGDDINTLCLSLSNM